MERLDTLVADHIDRRLLQPARLEQILSSVLHRREERAERRATHIAELRKRVTEVDAKLKRIYDAIENGVADLADPMLKDRVAELKAIRDHAHADAARAEGALERVGPTITPHSLKTFAREARKRLRTDSGGYRRDTFARWPSASRSTRKNFASWAPKASCCARSSPPQAQKRRVLACPVLYRSGVPDGIRTRVTAVKGSVLTGTDVRSTVGGCTLPQARTVLLLQHHRLTKSRASVSAWADFEGS